MGYDCVLIRHIQRVQVAPVTRFVGCAPTASRPNVVAALRADQSAARLASAPAGARAAWASVVRDHEVIELGGLVEMRDAPARRRHERVLTACRSPAQLPKKRAYGVNGPAEQSMSQQNAKRLCVRPVCPQTYPLPAHVYQIVNARRLSGRIQRYRSAASGHALKRQETGTGARFEREKGTPLLCRVQWAWGNFRGSFAGPPCAG